MAGAGQRGRHVPRVGHAALPGTGVVHGVQAGDDVVLQIAGDLVQVLEDGPGFEVQVRVGAGGGAQPAHGGGGVDAVAHDVPDDQRRLVVGQRDHVVPVAADLAGGLRGLVAGGEVESGLVGCVVGQQ